MGLAALGDSTRFSNFDILTMKDDGSLKLDYTKLSEEFKSPNIFGTDLSDSKYYADIAAMVQKDTENILISILSMLKSKYPTVNTLLCGRSGFKCCCE